MRLREEVRLRNLDHGFYNKQKNNKLRSRKDKEQKSG
jgi:hypothetical protein